ncbi:PAS domain S-box protein [Halorientalis halophila]|uniref:PAS domain-containing sensor histidine kinase n=1 Tax=Halorientalis halophila TaxID=3108499 RepID=UPI00300AFC36
MSSRSGATAGTFWDEADDADARARYRTLINAVDDGIYQLDADGRFVAVNEAITATTGYSREELLGEHVGRLLTDEALARVERSVADRLRADQPTSTDEVDVRTADGDTIPFEVRSTLLIEDGEFRGSCGVARALTAQTERASPGGRIERHSEVSATERTADALRETEERFQSLVDAVEEYAIFRLDPDGHVTSWNRGAKAIKGYEADEILGEHFSTFYTEADREAGVPARNLAAATETGSAEDEGWRVRKDGSRFWATVTITSVWGDDGTHRGYLKVTRDMTDRYRHEQELESELRRILGRISDAFYAVDEAFEFTHVNERAQELLQHPEEELLGETLWEVFPNVSDDDEVRRAFETAMNDQEPVNLEFYHEALDFWAEANLYPSETGISVYFRDVTDRREYERKLEASNERLEQFAYAASHDLQEPLRMVSSYLQLVESRYGDALDEEGREFLAFAVDGADRMRNMIDGLLQYSRVDSRGDPLEPVALNDVFADVRDNLQVKIDEHDAEITAEDLPWVVGDAEQLGQLFQNLLDNAIEYSGDESPRVHVAAKRAGDRWRIAVSDEGVGIDPDDADRIFEVFQSLEGASAEGSGIGLSLCERIVERHGGDIEVDSAPGEGATFTVTLPAVGEGDA